MQPENAASTPIVQPRYNCAVGTLLVAQIWRNWLSDKTQLVMHQQLERGKMLPHDTITYYFD